MIVCHLLYYFQDDMVNTLKSCVKSEKNMFSKLFLLLEECVQENDQ